QYISPERLGLNKAAIAPVLAAVLAVGPVRHYAALPCANVARRVQLHLRTRLRSTQSPQPRPPRPAFFKKRRDPRPSERGACHRDRCAPACPGKLQIFFARRTSCRRPSLYKTTMNSKDNVTAGKYLISPLTKLLEN